MTSKAFVAFQYNEVEFFTPKVFVAFSIQSGVFAPPEVFLFCLVDLATHKAFVQILVFCQNSCTNIVINVVTVKMVCLLFGHT